MQLSFITSVFTGEIAQAVCWMLVHSLWMGLLLTIITGIIMLATKKQTALLRYNLLSLALLLFTMTVLIVFTFQLITNSNFLNQQVAASTAAVLVNSTNVDGYSITENKTTLATGITGFLNQHAGSIAAFWMLIISMRCVRVAGGLFKIKQMKTTALSPVGAYWNERLLYFVKALHITSDVQFFQSGIAKIPMVLGHFKPVILFPLGLLTSLPAAEAEAVLLHELAHIRRKDYLVNMLQHFTEILFFFNPAVLWISALIKIERENCCDDLALSQSGNKRNYVNALVSFQEYHLNAPTYATTLAGNKKHLLQRVKRMLYNNNKTLNAMEKTFLTLCFIITVSLAVFFTQSTTAQNKAAETPIATNDTVPSIANRYHNPADFSEGSSTRYSEKIDGVVRTLYIFKRNGILYEIYGDVSSFKIDGKKIPPTEWGKYKELIDRLKKEYQDPHAAMDAAMAARNQIAVQQQELLMVQDKLKAEHVQLEAAKKQLQQQQQREMLSRQDQLKTVVNEGQLTALQQKLKAEQEFLLAGKNKLAAEQQFNLDKLKAADGMQNELLQQEVRDKLKQEIMIQQQKMMAAQELLLLEKKKLEMGMDKKAAQREKQMAEKEQLEQMKQKIKDEKKDIEKKTQEMKEKAKKEATGNSDTSKSMLLPLRYTTA